MEIGIEGMCLILPFILTTEIRKGIILFLVRKLMLDLPNQRKVRRLLKYNQNK